MAARRSAKQSATAGGTAVGASSWRCYLTVAACGAPIALLVAYLARGSIAPLSTGWAWTDSMAADESARAHAAQLLVKDLGLDAAAAAAARSNGAGPRYFEFAEWHHLEVFPSAGIDNTAATPWHTVEGLAEFVDANEAKGARVALLRGLLSSGDAKALLDLARSLPVGRSDRDTVDQRPTFEALLLRKGRWANESSEDDDGGSPEALTALRTIQAKYILPLVENRVHPYIRSRLGCPTCVVCTSLVRRYVQGERREHPWHFDVEAYATVVVPLSPSGSYTGGLYLQKGFDRAAREYLEYPGPLGQGDAVVHSYDLRHGVEVVDNDAGVAGERLSLILWAKDSRKSCEAGHTPWYEEDAAAGRALAQFNLGAALDQGLGAYQPDPSAARRWYRAAAEQGHAQAQYNLAVVLQFGRGAAPGTDETGDADEAIAWYSRAAKQGHVRAMHNFGLCLRQGPSAGTCGKTIVRDPTGGLSWIRKAAEQGLAEAQFELGRLLFSGGDADAGLAEDAAESRVWLERAAALGHEAAARLLKVVIAVSPR
eukprot:gnl/TRDRNA2_/TRDRNA2_90118_c0_seq1.p1 gnl/TRDRNA2_/TRDRNA2_90118_c0~~gnl/TRDRNA2_/TRDRNA2_90118_c0_seq1.p1  ORF type:complete len:541 (-),score=80.14 gnl/TRDRNA2_/TRDRNA2_90118_c0_seq1:200-1822(-)